MTLAGSVHLVYPISLHRQYRQVTRDQLELSVFVSHPLSKGSYQGHVIISPKAADLTLERDAEADIQE